MSCPHDTCPIGLFLSITGNNSFDLWLKYTAVKERNKFSAQRLTTSGKLPLNDGKCDTGKKLTVILLNPPTQFHQVVVQITSVRSLKGV